MHCIHTNILLDNTYETLPYATYRRPNTKTDPITTYCNKTTEFSHYFPTFSRRKNQGNSPYLDIVIKNCVEKDEGSEEAVENKGPLESTLGKCINVWFCSKLQISEISCISNQCTIPPTSLENNKDRTVETRFSLPSNVFLQPRFWEFDVNSTSTDSLVGGKYSTFENVKKIYNTQNGMHHRKATISPKINLTCFAATVCT